MKFQFLHIEKTAGMSLHAMLHRDRLDYISPDPRFRWNPDKGFVLRNFCNGGHNITYSSRFQFQFTIVRDPLARYISHFNWRKNVMGESWTFDEYLSLEEFKDFQFKKLRKYTNHNDVEAIMNFFSFIGVFEEFEKTICFLCNSLGLKPEPVLENRKTYKHFLRITDLSSAQLNICRKNNINDQALYNEARMIFNRNSSPEISLKSYKPLSYPAKIKQKSLNLLTKEPLWHLIKK